MRLQGIGCRVSQVDARLNVGLQQVGQAPLVQSSAAPRVATPIPSLRRSNALKLLIAVCLHSLSLFADTLLTNIVCVCGVRPAYIQLHTRMC